MAYTKHDHVIELTSVQELLDALLEVAKREGLSSSDEILFCKPQGGERTELYLKEGDWRKGEWSHITFAWGTDHIANQTWVGIEFDSRSNRVHDSSRFSGGGHCLSGHIHWSKHPQSGAVAFATSTTTRVRAAKGWRKIPFSERQIVLSVNKG